jgi:hypothetical protein
MGASNNKVLAEISAEYAMRPWLVSCKGFPDTIVVSETRSKAIYAQWMAAKEAGYKIPWTHFRAVRASWSD